MLRLSDEGAYTMIASNPAGIGSDQIFVDVEGRYKDCMAMSLNSYFLISRAPSCYRRSSEQTDLRRR